MIGIIICSPTRASRCPATFAAHVTANLTVRSHKDKSITLSACFRNKLDLHTFGELHIVRPDYLVEVCLFTNLDGIDWN